jgi:dTDP-4-dehydrorhamnose reductase
MGRGGQFFDWLTKSLVKDEEVKMFENIYFSPTPIQLLSEATEYLIKDSISGIVNISGGLRLSRFEFAEILMSINNKFSATIVPITASRDSNHFQHDLSLIQSNICKRFQTNDFDNYLLDELSS